MRRILIAMMFVAFSGAVMAQKTATVNMKTSAVCSMCKETIESSLIFEKGIVQVNLDVETAILFVKYKTSKTNPDVIRKKVSLVGYSADEVPADPAAYEALHFCCKAKCETKEE